MGLSKDVSGLEGLVAANAVDEVEFVDYMIGTGAIGRLQHYG